MSFTLKKILPHVVVVLGFILLSLTYFNPVLKGQSIFQSDIMQYIGMSKQQSDFREATGDETYWTNSAFGGMPTYQLGAKYPHNYIKKLDLALRFLPRPADYLFLYLLGFYIFLLVLKVDYRLSVLGAIAFGFSTYLIIILGVGHNSKAHAIAYMPLVLSGIVLTFRRNYVAGFLLTALAMALELVANHFQMTYYLLLLVLVLGIAYLVDAYKKGLLKHYFKSLGVLTLAVVLALALNASGILATQEYVKESSRGTSELTINPDGTTKEISSGLDKAYITQYSYGFFESLNLFIPRLTGGGNGEEMGKGSHTYEAFRKLGASPSQALEASKNAPLYWGDQPIVEAPAYVGAVVIFLFVLGLFLVRGRLKWWLVGGTLLSLLLSYGKNLEFLTDFFIYNVPLYNKFRAVTSIQVILELCLPVMAVFALARLFNGEIKKDEKLKALKYAVFTTGGIAVLLLLFKSSFDFAGVNDAFYRQNYGQDFVDALKADRRAVFSSDTWRTLLLVLVSAGLIFAYISNKLKEHWVIVAFAILIGIDLIGVDRRYVNNDDFVASKQVKNPYQMHAADKEIARDTTHFRVLDLTSSGARASYFHNSLNGYHAAKLRRYEDVYDFYITKNHMDVLNLLNTKYIIAQDENGNPVRYLNEEANGNAWFIREFKTVSSVNEEIKTLDSLDNKNIAVLNSEEFGNRFANDGNPKYVVDSLATIELMDHQPNYLKYRSHNNHDGFVVFSEIFYPKGWKTYIDGQKADHIRVNYTLRGMEIPKGKHVIEFKFDPEVVKTGSKITLASSVLFVVLFFVGVLYKFKRQ